MATQVYKNLSKIFGIILALIGIGALIGGMLANSFIKSQFEQQNIVFPSAEAIDAQVEQGRISETDGEAMRQYAGQPLLTGDQAKVFADNFIAQHMLASAKQAGIPDEQASYDGVGDPAKKAKAELTDRIKADNPNDDKDTINAKVAMEMANPMSTYPEAVRAAELDNLRNDIFFTGNAIRGMLLNAYGWGLIGKIANIAGIGLIIVGLVLAIWGFIPAKKKNSANA